MGGWEFSDYQYFRLGFYHCMEELSTPQVQGSRRGRIGALLEEIMEAAVKKLGAEQAKACLDEAAEKLRGYRLLDESIFEKARGRL